jgi:hypothetical protein
LFCLPKPHLLFPFEWIVWFDAAYLSDFIKKAKVKRLNVVEADFQKSARAWPMVRIRLQPICSMVPNILVYLQTLLPFPVPL